jgi:hypothetical protein
MQTRAGYGKEHINSGMKIRRPLRALLEAAELASALMRRRSEAGLR